MTDKSEVPKVKGLDTEKKKTIQPRKITEAKKKKEKEDLLKEKARKDEEEMRLNTAPDDYEGLEGEDKAAIEELFKLCNEHSRSPDLAHLVYWKKEYGKYFASSVDGGDLYIWRTLKRLEYKGLSSTGAMETQEGFEAALMKKCMLWPKIDSAFLSDIDAGVPPSVFKQIMHQSGFVSEEEALSLIRRI